MLLKTNREHANSVIKCIQNMLKEETYINN